MFLVRTKIALQIGFSLLLLPSCSGSGINFIHSDLLQFKSVKTITHFQTSIASFVVDKNNTIIATDIYNDKKLLKSDNSGKVTSEPSGAGPTPFPPNDSVPVPNLKNPQRRLLPLMLFRQNTANAVYILDPNFWQIRIRNESQNLNVIAGLSPDVDLDGYVEPRPDSNYHKIEFDENSMLTALAVDKNQNIFLIDLNKNKILEIDANGVQHDIAGDGNPGFKDGVGSEAKFNTPVSIVVDEKNNLFVADYLNHAVRKITPNGLVSTISNAKINLNHPTGLAFFKQNLLVVDSGNNRVVSYSDKDQAWSIFAGSGKSESTDGDLKTASFEEPQSIYVNDKNEIFIGENLNGVIRVIR